MESLVVVIATALVNGGVTWGIMSTKMAWMRRDLDQHDQRLSWLERRLVTGEGRSVD